MSRHLVRAVLAVIATLAVTTRASAQQQVFSSDDLTVSPYATDHKGLTEPQMARKHEALAVIAERAGDYRRAARHYAVACGIDSQVTRDFAMAAPICNSARALADQHGVVDARIRLLVSAGVLRTWTFNFPAAVATLKEAIALGKDLNPDHPDSAPLVAAHQLLGSTLVEMSQFDEARTSLTFGRDHCRTLGDSGCAAYADIWLCRMNTMLGDFSAARSACDAAQAEAAVLNDTLVLANLGWNRGILEGAINRPAAALAALQDAYRHASASSEPGILRPLIAQLIVDALVRLDRLDEAETWQRGMDEALKAGKIPFFMAPLIAMHRGTIAAERGRRDEAAAAFSIGSHSVIHETSIQGHVEVARMYRDSGNFEAARESLERAIAKIEAARTSVTGSALRTSYLRMHAGAFRELIRVRFDAEGAAAAPAILEIAEAARARGLRDALASAQVAGAAAPALKADTVQGALAADEVLVEYVSSSDRLLAITVTPSTITVTPLPDAGNEATLKQRVEFFYSLAQEGDDAALAPSARRLYDDVLAPAIAAVPSTAKTLIIAADGPLHRLPFDALGGSERVIDRWNVVYVPSAAALVHRAPQQNAHAALIVAAAATGNGLPPLAAAPEEAAAIRRRVSGDIAELSGTAATKVRLQREQLNRFSVLHFASHALVDEERPLLSSLVLANDNGVQGRWTAEEIYRAKLQADLVVLSACSTAAGATQPGEGVMSLSRAFLYAGARATIATLWNVPDAPGPVFADVLYRELASGAPLGAAAAEARRELRRRGAPPRVWSAYIVTGDPGTRVGITPRTSPRLITAGVSGAAAILLLIAAIVMRAAGARSRIRWTVLASTAAIFAVVAIGAPLWPADSYGDLSSPTERGEAADTIRILVSRNSVSWPAVAAADEHAIELFDEAGLPAGSQAAAVSPFALPAARNARWVRVVARRDGQAIAQSPLVRVTR